MIKIENVTKKYGQFTAVDHVSLNIEEGKIYGLVGKNGAGKSTLFKLILGLSHVNTGEISIKGSSDTQTLNAARSSIGFYMGPSFFGYLNAKENLIYYAKLKGIHDIAEVDRVLKIVNLDGVKKTFKQFSMGMKQRLGIANAIMGNPDIVMLDEPINGLDPQGILEIRNIIKDLSRVHHKTVIVSSHILSELELVADKFGIIDQGKILKEFEKEGLNDSVDNYIDLITSDNALAQSLLSHYEITQHDLSLRIMAEKIETKDLMNLLSNGIDIVKLNPTKRNLEDQYFALTGGVK